MYTVPHVSIHFTNSGLLSPEFSSQGVGHRLESPSLLPPLSSSSTAADLKNGNSQAQASRPISAPYHQEVKKSPKKKPIAKAASSRDLHRDYPSKSKKAVVSSTTHHAGAKSTEKCFLKVHGIGDAPFLMELVTYDTIKTVRSLLANVLKSEYIKQNRFADCHSSVSSSLPNSAATQPQTEHFKLFMGFPRRLLNDDSKSLGDLGLVPNGVLHLVRSNI